MAKTSKEDLADLIASELNSSSTTGKIAHFLGKDITPTDLKDFVGTGSSLLDLAISNKPHGGIACGRITELTGLEGSGKSLVAAHMMANVQKEDGVAVLIDTETAVNEDFFRSVGLDMSKMLYLQVDTVEQIFETIEKIFEIVKKSAKGKKVIIVVDSVSGAPTKREVEADYDKDGYATDKAIILGKAMRKITSVIGKLKIALVFTNQLRQKMNAPAFSDPWTTSGGKAIAFHASTRIRLSVIGKVKKDDNIVGVRVKAVVVKNRLGPPHRQVEFDVYFDRGIDDIQSWIDFLKDHEIVSGTAKNYTYKADDGKSHSFSRTDWENFIVSNPLVYEELYQKICTALIMSYSSEGISTEEGAEVETGEE